MFDDSFLNEIDYKASGSEFKSSTKKDQQQESNHI